jgi:hypothetical protein
VIVSDGRFRSWLEPRIGVQLPADAQFIGTIKAGQVVAAVAFSHWTGPDMELSVAGEPGSGSRRFLATVFGYVFQTAGCVRCTVKVRASNTRARGLATRLGFKREGIQRLWYGDEDALIFGLLRTDYEQQRQQATSRPGSGGNDPAADPVQPAQHEQPVRVADVDDRRGREPDAQHERITADAGRD